jgi:hypothetical protein
VFEAFNISSEHWDGKSSWAAVSLDGMFIIEGSVDNNRILRVNGIVDSKSNVNIGLRKSCRHLVCEIVDGEKRVEFTHYRASQVTATHEKLNFMLYVHPTGKKWAIAGIAERIRVINSKAGKGYNLDGLCTYEGIIKQ